MKCLKVLVIILTTLSCLDTQAQKYFDDQFQYNKVVSSSPIHTYFPNGDYLLVSDYNDSFALTPDTSLHTGSVTISELVVARYSSDHQLLWYFTTFSPGGGSSSMVVGNQVVILPNEQVVVCGSFTSTKNFGNGNQVNGGTTYSAFIMRLSSTGKTLNFSYRLRTIGSSLCRDNAGNYYMGGRLTTNGTNSEAYISKYTLALGHIHTIQFSGVNSNRATVLGLVNDADNNVYYMGRFEGDSLSFSNITLPGSSNMSFMHLFYGKLNSNLTSQWMKGSKVLSQNINLVLGQQIHYLPNHEIMISGTQQGHSSYGFDTLEAAVSVTYSFMLFCDTLGNGKRFFNYGLRGNSNARAVIGDVCVEDTFMYSVVAIQNGLASGTKVFNIGDISVDLGKNGMFIVKHLLNGEIVEAYSTPIDSTLGFTPFDISKYGDEFIIHLYKGATNVQKLYDMEFPRGTYRLSLKSCSDPVKVSLINQGLQFCEGSSSMLELSKEQGKMYWYKDNQLIDSNTIKIGVQSSGFYHSMGKALTGCDYYTDTVEMTENPNPVASFGGLQAAYCPIDTVVVLMGNPSGGVFSGMGISANNFNPLGMSPGNYNITYTYTDANTCVDTFTQSVRIKNNSECVNSLADYRSSAMSVYPNPAGSSLQVSLKQGNAGMLIKIFSSDGKLAIMESTEESNIQIDVSSLTEGVYMVLMESEGKLFSRQVIISR